jgi:hypothetical protein
MVHMAQVGCSGRLQVDVIEATNFRVAENKKPQFSKGVCKLPEDRSCTYAE